VKKGEMNILTPLGDAYTLGGVASSVVSIGGKRVVGVPGLGIILTGLTIQTDAMNPSVNKGDFSANTTVNVFSGVLGTGGTAGGIMGAAVSAQWFVINKVYPGGAFQMAVDYSPGGKYYIPGHHFGQSHK
jgi:hypothetical protein